MRTNWKNIGFSEEHLLDHRTTYSKLDRYWSRSSAIGNGKTGRGKGKGNGKTDPLKEFINDVDNPIYMLKCRYYLHALMHSLLYLIMGMQSSAPPPAASCTLLP